MNIQPKNIIQATLMGSTLTKYYSAPAATSTVITKLTACNTDSTAYTVDVHLVASGGTPGTSNAIVKGYPVAANFTVDITELVGHVLAPGASIYALASVASKVVIRGSGMEAS